MEKLVRLLHGNIGLITIKQTRLLCNDFHLFWTQGQTTANHLFFGCHVYRITLPSMRSPVCHVPAADPHVPLSDMSACVSSLLLQSGLPLSAERYIIYMLCVGLCPVGWHRINPLPCHSCCKRCLQQDQLARKIKGFV